MPPRRLGTSVALALIASVLSLVFTATPALADEVAPLVAAAEASPTGTVPVIVELATPAVPEATLTTRGLIRQREQIDAEASEVLATAGDSATKVRTYDMLSIVAMEATAEMLEDLAASDAVSGIAPDEVKTPLLDGTVTKIQANEAQAAGFDGAGFNVAVLDTGVESSHGFLSGKVVAEKCYSRGATPGDLFGDCPLGANTQEGAGAAAPCGYSTADCDHGTHVAGIAAGSRSGVIAPTKGVASGAGIVAVQVFSNLGPDANNVVHAGAYDSDILAALSWVYNNRSTYAIASVNMSLGGTALYSSACEGSISNGTSYKTVIDSLRAEGIPTVVASGNGGSTNGISAPACISSAISVGATGESGDSNANNADEISYFSNVSANLSLLAPGYEVNSSDLGNDYESKSGTSMAAPHVAGAWAILRDAFAPSVPTVDAALAAFRGAGVPVDDTIHQDIPRIKIFDSLKPLAPTGVTKTSDTGQVTLGWTAPTWTGLSALTGYEITASPAPQAGSATRTVASGTTSLAFTDLADGTAYTFTIKATNTQGAGVAATATATAGTLPGAPTGVTATGGARSASVSWTAPASVGSPALTSYRVTSAPGGLTSTVAGTTATVTGLTAGTGYTFSVVAINAVGDSASSSASNSVTPTASVPNPPTNVVATPGDGRADVSWTAPADNGGSAITSYRLVASPGDAPPVTVTGTSAAIGLTNGTSYTFTVIAINAIGESSPSASSAPVMPTAPSIGGGGGGGGGGSAPATTTTTVPKTTTTTTAPSTTTTTTAPPSTPSEPEPDPAPAPGAATSGGNVVTIRDGKVVTMSSGAPAGTAVVAGAATPSGLGAWSVTASGQLFTSGDAVDLGDTAALRLNAPIVGIAPTPSGDGYWLLGQDGGIFSFGDAAFFGSTGAMRLNQPVVGMASNADGDGYWLFAGDGGIFTFGDVRFFGSTGAMRLNAPITTMAPTPTGRGYWLLGADGGVFTFGDARFAGSTGGRTDVGRIAAIVPTDTGRGYWLIGHDGRIHRFGDAV